MKNRTMDLLKYKPLPELAAAVRAVSPRVVERWGAQVREALPAAHDLTVKQLRNDVPNVLQLLADALEADEPHPTKLLMDEAVLHGEDRFDLNFEIGDLLIEYSLLRTLLVQEATQHLGRDLLLDEVQALVLGVDVAARRSVVMFVGAQRAELQATVEAQSKFLSFLSHDLRGNLNGVLLMIEVLRRDLAQHEKFAESLEDLDSMRRSILETVSAMNRFLHAERFRKGKVQVHPSPIDLNALANDIISQYIYQAREKAIELVAQVPNRTDVVSDRELVTLILQNLVGNAVKFTKKGQVRLVIDAACNGGRACRISVIDQGPGIDKQKLKELFMPFTRGDTHGQPGTGLGLSIARQAADLLGAKLWAESEPGNGSTFHLELPATQA